jgi:N-acetyl-gamma-glutamyl-phosphate reductase
MHTVTPASAAQKSDERGSSSGGEAAAVTRVAVAGATGYTGQELLRLLGRHPAVTVTAAMSSGTSGTALRRLPGLARIWDGEIVPLPADGLADTADLIFLALPDKAAADLAPSLIEAGVRVVDLSGAFRLRDASARARWYPETRAVPKGLAYGLTELERAGVRAARLVSNPGCYPTAALLALAPLADAGMLLPDADVIVDAKSGVSGAGKTPTERTHFSECHGNLSAYGVFNHRHAVEIAQGLQGVGANLTFTPHLVPLDRGLMATIYVRLAPGTTEGAVGDVYARAYGNETFVRLTGGTLPDIKQVAYTNFCDIGWRVDPSGRGILISAIDNLLKGASGQAVQNMNVMLGIDDRTGLL